MSGGLGRPRRRWRQYWPTTRFRGLSSAPYLKLHWLGEAQRWLPSRGARVIDDTRTDVHDADLYIVSETALQHVLPQLAHLDLRAAVGAQFDQ